MKGEPVALPEIVVAPEWMTAQGVEAVFGISRVRLWELRNEGLVRWKRIPSDTRTDRILINAQSIREWLATLPDGEPKANKQKTGKQIA